MLELFAPLVIDRERHLVSLSLVADTILFLGLHQLKLLGLEVAKDAEAVLLR